MLAYLGGSVTSNRGKSHSIKGTHCDIGVWYNKQSEKFIYIYIYMSVHVRCQMYDRSDFLDSHSPILTSSAYKHRLPAHPQGREAAGVRIISDRPTSRETLTRPQRSIS